MWTRANRKSLIQAVPAQETVFFARLGVKSRLANQITPVHWCVVDPMILDEWSAIRKLWFAATWLNGWLCVEVPHSVSQRPSIKQTKTRLAHTKPLRDFC